MLPLPSYANTTINQDPYNPSGVGREWCEPPLYNQAGTDINGKTYLMTGPTTKYGYCHILLRHLQQPSLTPRIIDGASQFRLFHTEYQMMRLIMDVINQQPKLNHTSKPGRYYKDHYTMFDGSKVRVVFHDTRFWSTRDYDRYDYIIISAFPRFND